MMRRRLLIPKSETSEFIQILADETGKIPKTKIPLLSGQQIHMEWDPSNLTNSGCIFSFFNQVSNMNDVIDGWTTGGYPICWYNGIIGREIYYVGTADLTMPRDLNMYIACWTESEYIGTTERATYTPYINITIRG